MLIIEESSPIQLLIMPLDGTGIHILAIPIGMDFAISIKSRPRLSSNSFSILVDPFSSLGRFVLGRDHLQKGNALVGILQSCFDTLGFAQSFAESGSKLLQAFIYVILGEFLH